MLYECMYLFIYLYTYTIGFCTTEEAGSSKELMSWWADEENRERKNNIEQHRHWTQRLKNLMMRFFINLFINFNFLLNIIKYIEPATAFFPFELTTPPYTYYFTNYSGTVLEEELIQQQKFTKIISSSLCIKY